MRFKTYNNYIIDSLLRNVERYSSGSAMVRASCFSSSIGSRWSRGGHAGSRAIESCSFKCPSGS